MTSLTDISSERAGQTWSARLLAFSVSFALGVPLACTLGSGETAEGAGGSSSSEASDDDDDDDDNDDDDESGSSEGGTSSTGDRETTSSTTSTSTSTIGGSSSTTSGTETTTSTSTTGETESAGDTTAGDTTGQAGETQGDETGPDADFQPCPATGPCKILPLGDSITFGLRYDGGYRVELFRRALADDHEITFTGTQSPNGPGDVDGVPFPRNHEGISGQTIEQIAGRVPSPALNDPPHIILLHAGTNDMVLMPGGAETRLEALMDELVALAPDALVVVSNIVPFPGSAGAVDAFNATVQPAVEERATAGAHILFVDQFSTFPSSGLHSDGVHPNEEGYNHMGGVWYDAISGYLR